VRVYFVSAPLARGGEAPRSLAVASEALFVSAPLARGGEAPRSLAGGQRGFVSGVFSGPKRLRAVSAFTSVSAWKTVRARHE
jgi:hypothetical protein